MKTPDAMATKRSRRRNRCTEHSLSRAAPEAIVARGERALLKAFRRAAAHVPAYRQFLQECGVSPRQISDIQAFKARIPLLDKKSVFASHRLRDLCINGRLDDVGLFYSSSGHTNVFSFGVATWDGMEAEAAALEYLLDRDFDVSRRRTLLVNCLPMGVRILARTVPQTENGLRSDVVLTLVAELADEFDQFLLIGESLFLKKVIDEGVDAGIPWRDLTVHVITGGEFISESYRGYLGHQLGVDFEEPRRGMIAINMGLSELSLSIFMDNLATVRIRRAAQKDRKLRRALFGKGAGVCPEIMQYNPMHTYLETVAGQGAWPELVVTLVDPALRLPLIRYRTGDLVRLMPYGQLAAILEEHGYGALRPQAHLPVGLIWGKDQHVDAPGGGQISVQDVKEALYRDVEIAECVTGRFRLLVERGKVVVAVQLRDGRRAARGMAETLAAHVGRYASCRPRVRLMAHREFPLGWAEDFERKPRYT
jgi:phenylacetate-CoA ligase